MSTEEKRANELKIMQQTINELQILSENLNRNYQNVLQELQISQEEFTLFVTNPNNFTEKEWKEMHQAEEEMKQLITAQLTEVVNPKATKQKYAQRSQIKNNWIFVR